MKLKHLKVVNIKIQNILVLINGARLQLDVCKTFGQSSDLFFTTIDNTLKQIEDSKNKSYEFNNPVIK